MSQSIQAQIAAIQTEFEARPEGLVRPRPTSGSPAMVATAIQRSP